MILGEVNRLLAKYKQKHGIKEQYKMGPDPSSIDSCMIGGVVANNSSGMCCGVAQNTYHTLKDMRIVFVDGTVLDTSDKASREAFLKSHKSLVDGVVALASRVQEDEDLSALITKKHKIKCTTGYSMNALVDHPTSDPIEIIKRLMIGSEGTLGFVSQATYNTVIDHPHKASAFIVFKDVKEACRAAAVLRRETKVDAVELFDRASLTQCEGHEQIIGLVPTIADAPRTGAALLIECRGATDEELNAGIKAVTDAIDGAGMEYLNDRESTYPFMKDEAVYKVYWDVRKGLIPLVGSSRQAGTSVLIEDVACEVDKLGDMTQDLIDMFERFGYDDASCMGHALEGNLHLVFSQGFRNDEEVKKYSAMMQEMCEIVAIKYSGSLKAEHGTGRNVAPFVEMEWGKKAYDIMWELKELFDPEYVLNPGVILNRDPDTHQKFLKPKPVADPLVDMCMECGFCESNCPSRDLSLTPRQRITVYREISRLQDIPSRTQAEQSRLDEFLDTFTYEGNSTCAADGMCQVKCPVGINTGELIKSIRERELKNQGTANSGANFLAKNFGAVSAVVPSFLNMVSTFHGILGGGVLKSVSGALNSATGSMVPVWNPHMPTGAPKLPEPYKPAVATAGWSAPQGCLPPLVRDPHDGPGEGRGVHRRRPRRDDEHPQEGELRGGVPRGSRVAVLRHDLQQPRLQVHGLVDGQRPRGGAHGGFGGWQAAHRGGHLPLPRADQGAALQPGAEVCAVRAHGVHQQPPGGQARVEAGEGSRGDPRPLLVQEARRRKHVRQDCGDVRQGGDPERHPVLRHGW